MFTLIFFIAIIIGIFVLVQYTRQDYEVQLQDGQTAEEAARLVLDSVINALKGEVTAVLRDSAEQAVFDSAAAAIDAENGYLVSYGLSSMPPLAEAKDNLEARTLDYCNAWLSDLNGKELNGAVIESEGTLSQITVWVDELDLVSGDRDEAFNISGEAATGPIIAVEPSVVEMNVDDEFTFDITLNNVEGANVAFYVLTYDPAKLQIVNPALDISEGLFFKEAGSTTTFTPYSEAVGKYEILLAMMDETSGASGKGNITTIKFKALELGETYITIESGRVGLNTDQVFNTEDNSLSVNRAQVVIKDGELADPVYPKYGEAGKLTSSFEITSGNGQGLREEVEVPYSFTTQVQGLRYWYVYRHLYGWVQQDVISEKTCAHMPIVKGNASNEPDNPTPGWLECYAPGMTDEVVDTIVDESMADLMARMDGDVQCTWDIPCRFVETEFIWKDPCEGEDVDYATCVGWPCQAYESNDSCFAGGCRTDENCEAYGDYGSPGCQDPKPINYTGQYVRKTGTPVIANNYHPSGSITYSEKHHIRFLVDVQCVDRASVDTNLGELTWDFKLHVSMDRGDEPDDPPCPCEIGGGGGGGTAPEPEDPDNDNSDNTQSKTKTTTN
ncbi:MAG: cohesin domain-containing protein [archaeon]